MRAHAAMPYPAGNPGRILGTVLLVCCTFALAPEVVASQEIVGRVMDSATYEGLNGTLVVLVDSSDVLVGVTEADSRGQFRLQTVKPGRYRLLSQRFGYRDGNLQLLVSADDQHLMMEIQMVRDVSSWAPMEASAERRVPELEKVGFYQRRRRSGGVFLDVDQIADLSPVGLEELVSSVPGIDREDGQGSGCQLLLVLNGQTIKGGQWADVIGAIDPFMDAASIIGLEAYPAATVGEAHVHYRGMDAACGAVVIWTR